MLPNLSIFQNIDLLLFTPSNAVHHTHRVKEQRAEKQRKIELERMKREAERAAMLRQQEEARRRIPKAPPPPRVVKMSADLDLMMDFDDEAENVVLDVGMHTVKVRTIVKLVLNSVR